MLSGSVTAAVKIHPPSPTVSRGPSLLYFDGSCGFSFHVSNSWWSLTACELSSEYGDISGAAARGLHQDSQDFGESSRAIAQETDIWTIVCIKMEFSMKIDVIFGKRNGEWKKIENLFEVHAK
jgi:hypothetical protein